MEKLCNVILKGMDVVGIKEYLLNLIYQPEDFKKIFEHEKKVLTEKSKLTDSTIENLKISLKKLEKDLTTPVS